MSFLDHYNLRGLKRILKKPTRDIEDLKTKVNNLAQITLKDNLADQEAAGLRVRKTPTNTNDVMRLGDFTYRSIINSTGITANSLTSREFTQAQPNTIYEFICIYAINGIDYIAKNTVLVGSSTSYKYKPPLTQFIQDNTNLTVTTNIAFWYQELGVHMRTDTALNGYRVYYRKVGNI